MCGAGSGVDDPSASKGVGAKSEIVVFAAGNPRHARAAIVGVGAISRKLARRMVDSPQAGLEFSGLFTRSTTSPTRVGKIPGLIRGDLQALIALCRSGALDRVYVPLPTLSTKHTREIVERLADTSVSVHLVPDLSEVNMLQGRLQTVGDICTLSIYETSLKGPGGVAKRLFDSVLSALILAVIAVPMLLIALGVRLSSPGPVIFKQRRYGLDGREIVVWKFRSMTVTEDGDTITQAYAGDPRVTWFGSILRRTYLDELPQFINVLQGRMSIVGPRPHAAAHNEEYRRLIPFYMLRQRVKPGITGWAQANGWSGQTDQLDKMERRVEHDLWYIRNWSVRLDFRIIALTIAVVLKGVLKSPSLGLTAAATGAAPLAVSVLLLVENLPVPLDRRVWLEAASLRDRGCQVSIVCPRMYGHTAGYERLDGIDIHRYPSPFEAKGLLGYGLEYGAALAFMTWHAGKIWAKSGIDVIHVANPPDLLVLAALPFKLLGKRVIYDQHDLCPELFDAKGGGSKTLGKLLRGFERLSYRVADAVVVPNREYRDIAIDRGGKDPDSVFVVRNGPLRDALVPRRDVPLERLVGYVGVMGDQDGIDVLLDAAHSLRDRYPELRYVLLGDGSHRRQFEEYAAELGLADRVRFTGMVDQSRIAEELAPCSICVVPDRINEFTGRSTMNKVMEYMALEKPIVQFDSPTGRFSAKGAALYARPNDVADFTQKMAELLDDPERARRMGRQGRARFLRSLHWGRSVESLYQAYDWALGVSVPASPSPIKSASTPLAPSRRTIARFAGGKNPAAPVLWTSKTSSKKSQPPAVQDGHFKPPPAGSVSQS